MNDRSEAENRSAADEFMRLAAIPGNSFAYRTSDVLDETTADGRRIVIHQHYTAPGNASGSTDPHLAPDDIEMEIEGKEQQ